MNLLSLENYINTFNIIAIYVNLKDYFLLNRFDFIYYS